MSALFFQFFLLTLYTVCMGSILISMQASFLITTAVLSVAPLLVLWHRVRLSSQSIPLIALATLLATAVIELIAYKSGLWYEIDATGTLGWGGAPLTSYVFSVVHVLLMIVTYEYFFDDGRNLRRSHYARRAVVVAGLGYAAIAGYLYREPTIFMEYPFVVLLIGMSSLLAVLIAVKRQVPHVRLVRRALFFALATFPLSLVYECVMIANNIRFFANEPAYLYVLSWQNLSVPVEELFLIFLVPFGVAVLYELYFDDSK